MNLNSLKTHPYFFLIIALIVLSLLRLALAMNTPIWIKMFPDDDLLMIRYASLIEHFQVHDFNSLVKTMSYPVWLAFNRLFGIPYRISLCLVWIIAAGLTTYAFKHLYNNRFFLLFTYTFVLFCPAAFDFVVGTRVYRNAIIAPAVFISVALMLICIIKAKERAGKKQLFIWMIFSGLAFTFFYYIKEDSIWLLPLFSVSVLACIFYSMRRPNGTDKADIKHTTVSIVKKVCFCLTPFIVFACLTGSYLAVNYHFFGVAEINTRTEGEFGRFVSKVIKIEDENKNYQIWAPYSTWEKVWAASPTLQEYPQMLEWMRYADEAYGDLVEYPPPGDLVFWTFRHALVNHRLLESEKQMEDLLKQVNKELDAAFESGLLKRADKIYLSSMATGLTKEELPGLKPLLIEGIENNVFFKDYAPIHEDLAQEGSFRWDEVDDNLNDNIYRQNIIGENRLQMIAGMNNAIFVIYRILSVLLVAAMVIAFILSLVRLIRKRKEEDMFFFLGILLTVITAGVVILGISWFCYWIGEPEESMKYYAVGAVPIIGFAELLGICYLSEHLPFRIAKSSVKR